MGHRNHKDEMMTTDVWEMKVSDKCFVKAIDMLNPPLPPKSTATPKHWEWPFQPFSCRACSLPWCPHLFLLLQEVLLNSQNAATLGPEVFAPRCPAHKRGTGSWGDSGSWEGADAPLLQSQSETQQRGAGVV